MTDQELAAIAQFTQSAMASAATGSRGQFTAKVLSGSGGLYTVQADGKTIRGVQSASRIKWKQDQWVTVQIADGCYQIVGPAAGESDSE